MSRSAMWREKQEKHDAIILFKGWRSIHLKYLIHILGICLLLSLISIEFIATVPQVDAQSHTASTVNSTCTETTFSPDGNPFALCPGPYPVGGNCVWWAWEQWHLLGYNLPLNWGNAADWIVDAERTGLSIGTTPRVGAIAVFPRADGVWAYGTPGHVAFVTSVGDDGLTFNVTYQNYGDATPMYIGTNYYTPTINQARFQDNQLRFIYFPKLIDPVRFQQLQGIDGNVPQLVQSSNEALMHSSTWLSGSGIVLGSQVASSEQQFNADFTGSGYSDLLLYNRQQGSLSVLELNQKASTVTKKSAKQSSVNVPHVVSLSDATTAKNKWGSSLDIHIGDFDGSGHSEILLYDPVAGTIQVLTLTPQLTIKKHVTLSNWGADWEIYVGRFDGQRSGLFMYKRYAQQDTSSTPVSTNTPVVTQTSVPPISPTVQPSPTSKPKPTSTPKPTVTATPKPTVTPSPTATPKPTTTPTATPKPTTSPTATPKPTATPSPTATPEPTVTPTPKPTVTPSPTPKATPTVTPTPKATPSPTATPKTSPTVAPTVKPSVTPTPRSTSTVEPKQTSAVQETQNAVSYELDAYYDQDTPTPTPTNSGGDLSGSSLDNWEKAGRTANILVVDFNKDFSIHVQQSYTLWHANWEVYVGHFDSSKRDGIFLYDRLVGEGRIMDFNSNLTIDHYQESHQLSGNWLVSSGDFAGTGRAQLFFYDPSSGNAQLLSFAPDLKLTKQITYTKLGMGMIPYVGHFGMTNVSLMLYDQQHSKSTFLAFNKEMAISQQKTVQSWGEQSQILIGAFVDHAACPATGRCITSDDILVLNRKTGKIEQYTFLFGREFQAYDKRVQAFVRHGWVNDVRLTQVNTTSFSMLSTFATSIRDEELY